MKFPPQRLRDIPVGIDPSYGDFAFRFPTPASAAFGRACRDDRVSGHDEAREDGQQAWLAPRSPSGSPLQGPFE